MNTIKNLSRYSYRVQPINKVEKICRNCKKPLWERQDSGILIIVCNGKPKNGIDKCQEWEMGEDVRE
jgi:hypothetical protein